MDGAVVSRLRGKYRQIAPMKTRALYLNWAAIDLDK